MVAASPGCGCRGDEPTSATGPDGPVVCAFTESLSATEQRVAVDAPDCGSLVFDSFALFGDGDLTWTAFTDGVTLVPQVRAGAGGGRLRAMHWRGHWSAAGDAEPVLWRQGYQSWSATGVFPLTAAQRDTEGLPIFGGDDGVTEVVEETPWSSWSVGLAGRADGVSVIAGATASRASKLVVSFEADGTVDLVWGGGDQEIPIAPDGLVYLDPLWLAVGPDANALMAAWRDHVTAWRKPPAPLAPSPVGWATWYQYYDDVTEDDVRNNLAAAVAIRDDSGIEGPWLLQIDDGWERAWGDWTANDKFPSGMAALANDIAAEGFVPGLWMAPYYVDLADPLHAANPDWFLRDRQGAEVVWQDRAVLDTTHPDALAWMVDQVGARADEGYTYLKLDFLFAGAMDGSRYADVPGVVAYDTAMAAIRDRVGPNVWLLGCGAPLLPSVGWFDSFRTGPDIAFVVSRDPNVDFLRGQVRSTAGRSFTNGLWWWVDPDDLILRDPFGPAEASGAAAAQVVAGGPWLLGDDLTALPPEKLAVAAHPELIALRGGIAIPRDPLAYTSGFDTTPVFEAAQQDDQVPVAWDLPGGGVVLLNLSQAEVAADGPGGVELITGATAGPGPRTLAPGAGEVWVPAR